MIGSWIAIIAFRLRETDVNRVSVQKVVTLQLRLPPPPTLIATYV
jgi:hypothetical protein